MVNIKFLLCTTMKTGENDLRPAVGDQFSALPTYNVRMGARMCSSFSLISTVELVFAALRNLFKW